MRWLVLLARVVALAGREEQVLLEPVLAVVQLAVPALRGVERHMVAALDDAPLVHDDDLVRPYDGAETVGDDKAGAPLH